MHANPLRSATFQMRLCAHWRLVDRRRSPSTMPRMHLRCGTSAALSWRGRSARTRQHPCAMPRSAARPAFSGGAVYCNRSMRGGHSDGWCDACDGLCVLIAAARDVCCTLRNTHASISGQVLLLKQVHPTTQHPAYVRHRAQGCVCDAVNGRHSAGHLFCSTYNPLLRALPFQCPANTFAPCCMSGARSICTGWR
jgi:hypothetical protein